MNDEWSYRRRVLSLARRVGEQASLSFWFYLIVLEAELVVVLAHFPFQTDAATVSYSAVSTITGWAAAGACAGLVHRLVVARFASRAPLRRGLEAALLALLGLLYAHARFSANSLRWYVVAATCFATIVPAGALLAGDRRARSAATARSLGGSILAGGAFIGLISINALYLFPRWRPEVASVLAFGFLLWQLVLARHWLAHACRTLAFVAAGGVAVLALLVQAAPNCRLRATSLALRQLDLSSVLNVDLWLQNTRQRLVDMASVAHASSAEPRYRERTQDLLGQPPRAANVLFLVVDALRADYFLTPEEDFGRTYPKFAELNSESCAHPLVWGAANSTALALPTLLNGTFSFREPALPKLAQHIGGTLRVFGAAIPDLEKAVAGRQPEEGIWADEMVDQALRTLATDANSGRPWIYYMHFADVHMTRKTFEFLELAKGSRAARHRYVMQTQKVDRAFGRLMHELKRRGEWENTVVALTADHGELLNEWGVVMHGGPLSEGSVRIPFVLKGLSRSCPYRDLPLSAADVYPAILEELGMSRVPEPEDLAWPPTAERSLLMYAFWGGRGFAIVSDGKKYILDERSRLLEVYDVLADPGEHRNIITTADAARVEQLRRSLPGMMTVHMGAN